MPTLVLQFMKTLFAEDESFVADNIHNGSTSSVGFRPTIRT